MFLRDICVSVFSFLVHKLSSPLLAGDLVVWIIILCAAFSFPFSSLIKKNVFGVPGSVLLNLMPLYEVGHPFC